jgi:hypothetical protein
MVKPIAGLSDRDLPNLDRAVDRPNDFAERRPADPSSDGFKFIAKLQHCSHADNNADQQPRQKFSHLRRTPKTTMREHSLNPFRGHVPGDQPIMAFYERGPERLPRANASAPSLARNSSAHMRSGLAGHKEVNDFQKSAEESRAWDRDHEHP